ncbi:MAG TPA: hypothetical protein VFK76_07685 [Gaiellaceae bacterium]|nr:hypothetical protein [Gaiellaceae bacterium]
MRRFLKWALITLGIAAVVRKLRSRRGAADDASDATLSTPTSGTTPTSTTEDPADELRRKLADTREPETSQPAASVDDRRAEVHDQGRSAIDEMSSSAGDE